MKARMLRAAALDELRRSIAQNLSSYREGSFDYLLNDPGFFFEHNVEVDIEQLAGLTAPSGGSFYEVENCATVYAALNQISPYDARDERFWVYLSHTALLDHARRRWPIPSDGS